MHKLLYVTGEVSLDDYQVIETYRFDNDYVHIVEDRGPDAKFRLDSTPEEIVEIDDEFSAQTMTAPADVEVGNQRFAGPREIREFHNVQDRTEPSTVVVMDSGIDAAHPVFEHEITQFDATQEGLPIQEPEDSIGHGTAVAGQIKRMNPQARLASLRVFGEAGSTGMRTILRAYEWLNGHAHAGTYDIVNMSWGTRNDVPTINRVHEKLVSKGVQDVVAAGNTGSLSGSPGTAESAYSVGSCTPSGEMSDFSSYNPDQDNPELTAIGENVHLARAGGTSMGKRLSEDWTIASGTSFAAPEVAGILSTSPEPNELADGLVEYARDIPDTPRDGSGVADHEHALEETEPTEETGSGGSEVVDSTTAKVWSFAGMDSLFLRGDFLESGEYEARVREDGTVLIDPNLEE